MNVFKHDLLNAVCHHLGLGLEGAILFSLAVYNMLRNCIIIENVIIPLGIIAILKLSRAND